MIEIDPEEAAYFKKAFKSQRKLLYKNTWFLIVMAVIIYRVTESSQRRKASPPILGEFIICLVVPVDRQLDRLGDFEEKFNAFWVPRFGARAAQFIYLVQAFRSALAFIGFGAFAALLDRAWRVLGR